MSLLCLFCLPLSESLCVCLCVLMGNTSLSDRRMVTDRQSRDEERRVGFVVTCSSSRHFSAPSQCLSACQKDFVILVYDSWFTGWNRWEGADQQKTLHAHKRAHRKTPGYDSHHHLPSLGLLLVRSRRCTEILYICSCALRYVSFYPLKCSNDDP